MADSNTPAGPDSPPLAETLPVPAAAITAEFTLTEQDLQQFWADTVATHRGKNRWKMLALVAAITIPLLALLVGSWFWLDWRFGGPWFGACVLALLVWLLFLTQVTPSAERRSLLRKTGPSENQWRRVAIFPDC